MTDERRQTSYIMRPKKLQCITKAKCGHVKNGLQNFSNSFYDVFNTNSLLKYGSINTQLESS